jgi:5-methylcytosine-specific restriction endonuclease McrA
MNCLSTPYSCLSDGIKFKWDDNDLSGYLYQSNTLGFLIDFVGEEIFDFVIRTKTASTISTSVAIIGLDSCFWKLKPEDQTRVIRFAKWGTAHCQHLNAILNIIEDPDFKKNVLRQPRKGSEYRYGRLRCAIRHYNRNPIIPDYVKELVKPIYKEYRKLTLTRWFQRGHRIQRISNVFPNRAAERRKAYSRDKSLCRYCGKLVGSDFHLDHIIPKSIGGTNDSDNLATACANCNLRKTEERPLKLE